MSRKSKRRNPNRSRRLAQYPSRRRGPGQIRRIGDRVFELVDFEIVYGPVDDPYMNRIPPRDRERVRRISVEFNEEDEHARFVNRLEALVEEFPDFPKAYNHLTCAYFEAGEEEKAFAILRETRRRFPDYLFGLIVEANAHLAEGRPEQVTALLDRRFALPILYPHRRQFHISEYVGFHDMLVRYFLAIGELESAWQNYRMLREAAPDDPATHAAGASLEPHSTRGLLERMFERGRHDRDGAVRRLLP